ncbi:MAG: isoprenylcysteine carboxylmethyltransferase family protein [Nitrospirae bacterium]|nr:MAG: isoprenylcysteine carboxylmethyltransferase family protein [Nitrospirota bacterium]
MKEVFIIFVTLSCFGLFHSVLSRESAKIAVARYAGTAFVNAFYRLIYTIFSIVTTVIAFAVVRRLPDVGLFNTPVWLVWPMHLIQLAGLLFGASVFRVLDPWEFLGFRQAWSFICRREGDEGKVKDIEGLSRTGLVTVGPYRIVRHPLYAAGLIFFTFGPVITRNRLFVTILADLYFVYGALSEERRMLKRFGTEYREYMKRTPRFIPYF